MDATESEEVTALAVTEQQNLPARRERRSEVIRPHNAEALVQSFAEYQQLLPKLLDAGDWQDAGRGESFVKKSGWRKIATAFDLDVQIISSHVGRDAAGNPSRAEVIARAITPAGRSMDGDGYCSVDEPRFAKESARGKLENDLRATATTRAKNRAIADLVGMGAVSAEEVSAGPGPQQAPPVPPWALRADRDPLRDATTAVLDALNIEGDERDRFGRALLEDVKAATGTHVPAITVSVLRAIVNVQDAYIAELDGARAAEDAAERDADPIPDAEVVSDPPAQSLPGITEPTTAGVPDGPYDVD